MSPYDDNWPGVMEVIELPGWSERRQADSRYFGSHAFIETFYRWDGTVIASGFGIRYKDPWQRFSIRA